MKLLPKWHSFDSVVDQLIAEIQEGTVTFEKSAENENPQPIPLRAIVSETEGGVRVYLNFPDPKTLADYERLTPGSSNRLIEFFEKEGATSERIEEIQLETIREQKAVIERVSFLGLWLGIGIFSATLIGGLLATLWGFTDLSILTGIFGLVVLVFAATLVVAGRSAFSQIQNRVDQKISERFEKQDRLVTVSINFNNQKSIP